MKAAFQFAWRRSLASACALNLASSVLGVDASVSAPGQVILGRSPVVGQLLGGLLSAAALWRRSRGLLARNVANTVFRGRVGSGRVGGTVTHARVTA